MSRIKQEKHAQECINCHEKFLTVRAFMCPTCVDKRNRQYASGVFKEVGYERSEQIGKKKREDKMDKENSFELELMCLLNKYCKKNDSDTPGFILGEYLLSCLKNFNQTVKQREKWHGRLPKKGQEGNMVQEEILK